MSVLKTYQTMPNIKMQIAQKMKAQSINPTHDISISAVVIATKAYRHHPALLELLAPPTLLVQEAG
jgi:hypothetical protein